MLAMGLLQKLQKNIKSELGSDYTTLQPSRLGQGWNADSRNLGPGLRLHRAQQKELLYKCIKGVCNAHKAREKNHGTSSGLPQALGKCLNG